MDETVILPILELLYRRMKETGARILEFDAGGQEKLRLVLKSAPTSGVSDTSDPSTSLRAGRPDKPDVSAPPRLSVHDFEVAAPLSGVFYRAASPSAPHFVEDGSSVKAGDILGIIEAMKVMNEIKAPRPGKIARIFAVNGKHVKKGDKIFLIYVPASS
ncbi:MAG: acetyl-CoA carboxylase biotin carboxyl carrier protein [Elusimicrobia bacterium]|nr:acetyl-CoA carboxylase biotin carboxyl carrier protein [Elusimicrobiota bacterium]